MHVWGTFEQMARAATTTEEALGTLHAAGASPVEAIRALTIARGLSLADAKRALHSSPAWHAEARATESFHDDIIDAIDKRRDERDNLGI